MAARKKSERPEKTRPIKRLRAVRHGFLPTMLTVLLVGGVLWGTYQFVEPAPPRSLTIASGSSEGAYYRFAQALKTELGREDVELEIIETAGSVENVALLKDGTVDVGFVQSGITDSEENPVIEGVGSVYYEPIWVFSAGDTRLQRMTELAGLRIAAGPDGSGTQRVVRDLLSDNGIAPDEIQLSTLSGRKAADALIAGELDVVITIAGTDANIVQRLLIEPGILLMDMTRASAYERRYSWMSGLVLPEGVADLAGNIPQQDVRLVSAAALLVSREDLHPALGELMAQAADRVFSRDTVLSRSDQFPSPDYLDFPLSPEASRYYKYGTPFLQRYLPFWAANLIDRLKLLALPLLALLLPLFRILPPAYRWTVRKKIFRWYEEVQIIDQSAVDNRSPENTDRCLNRLSEIDDDARDIDVPLGYAYELYILRQHIDLLRNQIIGRAQSHPAVVGPET